MKHYKVKVKRTIGGRPVELKSKYGSNHFATIQAVHYNCTNPASYLRLLDGDGDEFMFRIPGQAEPNPTTPEVPVTVRLPISYIDDIGGNEIILWGRVEKGDPLEGFDSTSSL
jgi:hypothetical protein